MITESFSFPKQIRITKPALFRQVFDNPEKLKAGFFIVLYKKNTKNHPRLGIIVGKKYLPKAVQRSKVKRLVRESFRKQRGKLPALDMVVIWTRRLKELDDNQIQERLEREWQRLSKRSLN